MVSMLEVGVGTWSLKSTNGLLIFCPLSYVRDQVGRSMSIGSDCDIPMSVSAPLFIRISIQCSVHPGYFRLSAKLFLLLMA